ncbi:MAG: type I polyketide synthase [Candidatus Latescibacterota bacterium]
MDRLQEEKYKATLRAARDKIQELTGQAEELRRRLETPGAPVAVIGMAGEFPHGESADAFRKMLLDGVDASGPIPSSRWDHAKFYSPTPGDSGKYYCDRASFLDRDPFAFDNEFFGISPAETEMMDPQQRILYSQSWHALEDAGIPPSTLRGSDTGVFVGISSFDYMIDYSCPDIYERSDPYALTGSTFNSTVGRLSYYYDLHGPCIAVDTACSSSLVAVLLAVESLRKGECPVALTGGVNLILSPVSFIALSSIRGIASDGRCRAFGEGATGFGRGEGCGIVVLKRLDDARADGDRIHAVILGGATGHDGKSAGFTAPSGIAQRRIIERALHNAGVSAGEVGYVETHGTGTELGDPIEVEALSEVFHERTSKLQIGSVKSNIGHLEAAAGIAALFKTIFAVRDGVIPPSLHAGTLSSRIEWANIPVEVCRESRSWLESADRRIAGVSSFGISGTGAHVIVARPPVQNNSTGESAASDSPDWRVLPLSAQNGDSLRDLAASYAAILAGETCDFQGICDKAARGRDHFMHRLAVSARNAEDAVKSIRGYLDGKNVRTVATGAAGERIRTAFLFSGQGSQTAGMGCELYATHPAFKSVMDRCENVAVRNGSPSLLKIMFDDDSEMLNRTRFTQPAIYALEAALVDLWRSFGVRPSVVVGHSIGEYAAAYAAGVFSLEDGMEIVLERARLADSIRVPGLMAAVLADESTARSFVDGTGVDIAAVNGDDNLVISGPRDAVTDVLARMRENGIESRELPVSHAFHSPLIEPVLDEYKNFLRGHLFEKPKVRFVSSMHAKELTGQTDWPCYWTEQMRHTVRFPDAIAALGAVQVILEIGSSPTLTSLCRNLTSGPIWLFSQGPSIPAWKQVSLTLAKLYTTGYTPDFGGSVFGRSPGADLPRYPFREKVLRPSPPAAVRPEAVFGIPSPESLPEITSGAVKRIMHMQVTSMKRLFDKQLDTLGRLSSGEAEPYD